MSPNGMPQRTALRETLRLAGFGLLQSGLWIAPNEVDVRAVLGDQLVDSHVRWFYARSPRGQDMAALLREAHDLDELATAYRHFLQRWDATHAPVDDALAGRILMAVEWMRLKTSDPHLPLAYVPEKWPALEATAFLERRLRETGDQTAQQARRLIVLLH